LLGPGDASSIGAIKRKTGINVFQGSIFDGPDAPTMKLIQREEPAELHSFDQVLKQIGYCNPAPGSTAVACDQADTTTGTAWVRSPACAEVCVGDNELPAGLGVVRAAVSACYDALGGKKVGIGRTSSAKCDEMCENSCRVDDDAELARPRRPIARFTRSSVGLSGPDEWQTDPMSALRHASRGLDEVAANLEEQERYSEADAVREAAQQLRVKARDLKKTAGSSAQLEVHPDKPVAYYVPAGPRDQDDRQAADELHYFEFAPMPAR
jgi:hypothetical protein